MANLSNYTKPSISGFIAGDPKLTFTNDGTARFYVRVGINHFNRLEDGSFQQLDPTFHDLIQFGKGAERTAEMFVKGDQFVAQGQIRDYTREVDGQERTDEQFVASRVTHDANTTTYTVTHNREQGRGSAQAEAADRVPEDRPLSTEQQPAEALTR
jgi:single-stranded DNA-binding protein